MASQTQICNMALTRLAATRIQNISDATTNAQDCAAIFDIVLESVIALGEWSSSTRRASLAQLATAPDFGYGYAYQLPTNPKFITLIEINQNRPGEINYAIEGDQLLTDESSVNIRYGAKVTDMESLDVYLREALIDRLVAELIYKNTGNLAAYQASLKYANDHAKELMGMSNSKRVSRYVNSDTFLDARDGVFPVDESRLRDQ